MNEQDQHIEEQIQAYLKGKLTGEPRLEFESVLAKDVNLKDRLKKEQLIQDLIIRNSVNDLFQTTAFNSKGPSSNNLWYWGGLVAVVLITAFGFLFIKESNLNVEPGQQVVNSTIIESDKKETISDKPVLQSYEQNRSSASVDKRNSKFSEGSFNETENKQLLKQDEESLNSEGNKINHEEVKVVNEKPLVPASENSIVTKNCRLNLKEIGINPACIGGDEGILNFEKLTSGTAPFEVFVNGNKISSNQFNAPAGKYLVKVMDGAGCVMQDYLKIDEELCIENKLYVLNTALGTDFTYPIPSGFNGIIQVINQAGEIVFKDEILNGYPDHWNGYSKHGSLVSQGAYVLLLQPKSGKPVKLVLHVVNN